MENACTRLQNTSALPVPKCLGFGWCRFLWFCACAACSPVLSVAFAVRYMLETTTEKLEACQQQLEAAQSELHQVKPQLQISLRRQQAAEKVTEDLHYQLMLAQERLRDVSADTAPSRHRSSSKRGQARHGHGSNSPLPSTYKPTDGDPMSGTVAGHPVNPAARSQHNRGGSQQTSEYFSYNSSPGDSRDSTDQVGSAGLTPSSRYAGAGANGSDVRSSSNPPRGHQTTGATTYSPNTSRFVVRHPRTPHSHGRHARPDLDADHSVSSQATSSAPPVSLSNYDFISGVAQARPSDNRPRKRFGEPSLVSIDSYNSSISDTSFRFSQNTSAHVTRHAAPSATPTSNAASGQSYTSTTVQPDFMPDSSPTSRAVAQLESVTPSRRPAVVAAITHAMTVLKDLLTGPNPSSKNADTTSLERLVDTLIASARTTANRTDMLADMGAAFGDLETCVHECLQQLSQVATPDAGTSYISGSQGLQERLTLLLDVLSGIRNQ